MPDYEIDAPRSRAFSISGLPLMSPSQPCARGWSCATRRVIAHSCLGAVGLSRSFGVSELLIGLTVIAAGTSLPELASAFASTRRGQNELMLGNIIGSNFLNSVAVVGTSGATSPFRGFSSLVFKRDLPVMVLLTLSIGIFGFNLRNPRLRGTIPRPCGIIWLPHFSLI